MPGNAAKILILSASVALASCGASRTGTQLRTPPAPDLKVEREPAYPLEVVLAEGPEVKARKVWRQIDPVAKEADDQWNDRMVIWGRKGWGQVKRICRWALDLGAKLPEGWCEP